MPAETHSSRDGDGAGLDVTVIVREAIADVVAVDADGLAPSTLLADLGVEGLVLLDVVELVEEELGERTVGLAIGDDDLADLRTVGDLADAVRAALRREGAG